MSERWLNAERPAAPVVYRNDDGTCLVDWNTPDGNMPSEPVLMTAELILYCIDAINRGAHLSADMTVERLRADLAIAARVRACHQSGAQIDAGWRTYDRARDLWAYLLNGEQP